jgi:uncharacterized protein
LRVLRRHIPRGLYLVAQLAPALAAMLVTLGMQGPSAVKALLAPTMRVRQSPWWYVLVVALPPGTLLLAAAVYRVVAGPLMGSPTWSDLPLLIVLGTPLSLGEEIGWRGYLLPTFLRRYSPLVATGWVAFWWGLWHAPAYLPQSGGPAFYLVFLSGVFPVATFLTWIFLRTRSLLLCGMFHASIDAAANCFSWLFSPQHLLFVGLWIVVLWVAAIPVLLAIQPSTGQAKTP